MVEWMVSSKTVVEVQQSTIGDSEREYTLCKDGKAILSARCLGWRKRSNRLVCHRGSVEGTVKLLTPDASGLGEVKLTLEGLLSSNMFTINEPIFWTFWTSPEVTFGGKSSRRTSFLGNRSKTRGKEKSTEDVPWTFSIALPTDIEVKTKSGPRRYPLPPSFKKSKFLAFLEYSLVITISRGFMHEPLELRVPFTYEPSSYPEYPLWSTASVVSYTSEQDDLTLSGVAFGNRPATLTIRTFLRQPLIYARGETVSVTSLLECDDSQLLDLLASPQYFCVRLTQRVTVEGTVLSEVLREGSSDKASPLIGQAKLTGNQRTIVSRILIPNSTSLSFEFENFVVEHFLILGVRLDGLFVLTPKVLTEMPHRVQIITERTTRPLQTLPSKHEHDVSVSRSPPTFVVE